MIMMISNLHVAWFCARIAGGCVRCKQRVASRRNHSSGNLRQIRVHTLHQRQQIATTGVCAVTVLTNEVAEVISVERARCTVGALRTVARQDQAGGGKEATPSPGDCRCFPSLDKGNPTGPAQLRCSILRCVCHARASLGDVDRPVSHVPDARRHGKPQGLLCRWLRLSRHTHGSPVLGANMVTVDPSSASPPPLAATGWTPGNLSEVIAHRRESRAAPAANKGSNGSSRKNRRAVSVIPDPNMDSQTFPPKPKTPEPDGGVRLRKKTNARRRTSQPAAAAGEATAGAATLPGARDDAMAPEMASQGDEEKGSQLKPLARKQV